MLTTEEKQKIVHSMKDAGWATEFDYFVDHKTKRVLRFDANDAALVKDELVKQGKYEKFEDDALLEDWCKSDPARSDEVFSAWLLTVVHGEATNFFRSFAKWIEER